MPGKAQLRTCERCQSLFESKGGDKFCKDCRKAVLAELKDAGYLTLKPWATAVKADNRGQRDLEPSPWQENAVRSLEDG